MKKRPISLLSSPRRLGAHQELAAAVIRQALHDAVDPGASEGLRANARTFLAGSQMLRQWCQVAGLDLGCVQKRCPAPRPTAVVQPRRQPLEGYSPVYARRANGSHVRQQSPQLGT